MTDRETEGRAIDVRRLDRLRAMARIWDDLIRIPVIGRRIGLDALIGLIPGVGDVAGALVASWGLVVATTLRAPLSILVRMLLNIGVDTLVGVVPVVGDLFDIGWRAQRRNVALLERWIESPTETQRASVFALAGVGLGLTVCVVGSIWLAVRTVVWLIAFV